MGQEGKDLGWWRTGAWQRLSMKGRAKTDWAGAREGRGGMGELDDSEALDREKMKHG